MNALSGGCGYRFAGVPTLPQGVQSVSFAEFENETLEPGVEKELQWAFEREFRNHAGITIAKQGEGILNVTLNDIHFRPLTFDQRDQVLEYEAALAFDISLTHRDTGNVLWQQNNIRIAEDYSAIPQVVVTTSPEFLQGTLDPKADALRAPTMAIAGRSKKSAWPSRVTTGGASSVAASAAG